MREQRPPGKLVQDLRPKRAHPGALAGSEDDREAATVTHRFWSFERGHEKACPGLDPGWGTGFRKGSPAGWRFEEKPSQTSAPNPRFAHPHVASPIANFGFKRALES